ncbi:peroxidase-like isoform X3 [Amphibalanus amphitrite]|uniref:peroxidase-like isoform X3 n=1 Tax=Amphibalanus amphitrite TaxID=1232801 RepID=UPI001C91CEB5|nr:peroxidase-like isoform X3 [Amphibalanus amphitrite]
MPSSDKSGPHWQPDSFAVPTSEWAVLVALAAAAEEEPKREKRQIVFGGSAFSSPSPHTRDRGSPAAQCSSGECSPLVFCSGIVSGTSPKTTAAVCDLGDGSTGLCCRRDPVQASPANRIRNPFTKPFKNVNIRFINTNELNGACRKGIQFVDQQRRMGEMLLQQDIRVRSNTPDAGHFNFFKTSKQALDMGNNALFNSEAGNGLLMQFGLTPDQGAFGLQQFSVLNTIINQTCAAPPRCNPGSVYRSADGSCNNLNNPAWGMSRTALQRILAPAYENGIFTPRVAADGGALPSARDVSNLATGSTNDPYPDLAISVMTWGQFLDHDLSISPIFRLEGSSGIECCTEEGKDLPVSLRHPQCFPIPVSEFDPFYRQFGRTCLNFVRSLPAPRPDCNFGYAEQMNALTHYMDASMIYGSDDEQSRGLRAFRGGLLLNSRPGALPVETGELEECFAKEIGAECYKAGDGRVNENLPLTVMHTVWMREHNRVARALDEQARRLYGQQLSDEQLYQEARRIVTAEWQHINYNEWLPIVLGRQFMDVYDLKPKTSGYSFDYRPDINPSINNEFSTAAFRFGHTLVQNHVQLFRDARSQSGALQLRDVLNNPSLLNRETGILESVVRGFYLQRAQRFDENVIDDLKNHLFQPPGGRQGMDLVALNVQRGRDHGIPSYNEMREKCGLRRATRFEDLYGDLPNDVVDRMRSIYRSVDDIDLFPAGIAERPVPGALLGHTFLCIVGDQFARLKKGDRFFYDLGGQPHSFTEAQLFEIRKTSWARIMCDNVPGLAEVQPLAFYTPNFYNQLTSCSSYAIPSVGFAAFASPLQ